MFRKFAGLAVFLTLTLFILPFPSYAYYQSPLDMSDDNYIVFGDADHPWTDEYDMTLTVQSGSVSHTAVNLTVQFWNGLITQRGIDKFIVLANNKIVEVFRPVYIQKDDGSIDWSGYYVVKPESFWFDGGEVTFQVVAVDEDSDQFQYAVAWTALSDTVKFDYYPVVDYEAISVLYAILEKLKDLESLLAAIEAAIKKIYTPSPQKVAEFNAAMDAILDKMPMKEMSDEIQKLNDALDDQRAGLGQPYHLLVLGGEFEMIPGVAASRVKFLDLTPMTNLGGTNYVALFRQICDAALWIFFFYMLFKWITPKPEV